MLLLLAKFTALFLCILYLHRSRKPGVAALLYAVLSLCVSFALWPSQMQATSIIGLAGLTVGFFFDLGTAGLVFQLMTRYGARITVFYSTLVLGVAINLIGQYWIFQTTTGSSQSHPGQATAPRQATHLTYPPHVWSHHRTLSVSAETCARRGLAGLHALEFTSVARSGTHLYGNSGANRAVVKCVEQDEDKAFVYVLVAGPDKAVVEQLRNQLARSLQ